MVILFHSVTLTSLLTAAPQAQNCRTGCVFFVLQFVCLLAFCGPFDRHSGPQMNDQQTPVRSQ